MAHNPLLGSHISLISKKDIRYEGTLYSINEKDATVALQNVRAFGTEHRAAANPVPPSPPDVIHPLLLFRGCDIKDLHVHEQQQASTQTEGSSGAVAAVAEEEEKEEKGGVLVEGVVPPPLSSSSSSSAPAKYDQQPPKEVKSHSKKQQQRQEKEEMKKQDKEDEDEEEKPKLTAAQIVAKDLKPTNTTTQTSTTATTQKSVKSNRSVNNKSNKMVGTGASLLNRKVRGGSTNNNVKVGQDFDFEDSAKKGIEEFGSSHVAQTNNYSKNDFFDSISCDVTDKLSGVNTRLRGAEERKMNTETFGATSIVTNNRRYYNTRGGRGRGGRGRARGGGRGSGGGRGRGGAGEQHISSHQHQKSAD